MAIASQLVISQTIPVPAWSPGLADFVGFGEAGVTIIRNSFQAKEQFVLPEFGLNAGAWVLDRHVRLLADTTGDGGADIVGFGESGVYVSLNSGNNSFAQSTFVHDDFAYSQGWRVDEHLRFMADLRNTGRADMICFGDAGVYVSLNQGNGQFGPTQFVLSAFGAMAGNWSLTRHLRFVGDVNGDRFADIVGFSDTGVSVSLSKGDGTFQSPILVLPSFGFTQGWQVDQNPRFLADLNGDGKVDIIGFGNDGVYISLNNGNGTFQPARLVLNDFSTQTGWTATRHEWAVADITGDGRADIVGFKDEGVYVSINNGDGTFQSSELALDDFGYNQYWRIGATPRWVVDLTGDGVADIAGIGGSGFFVAYSDGKGGFGNSSTEIVGNVGYLIDGWSNTTTVKYVTNLYHP